MATKPQDEPKTKGNSLWERLDRFLIIDAMPPEDDNPDDDDRRDTRSWIKPGWTIKGL